ncbi:MAG TPA: DUF2884 family protein [Lysobacter sp.]|nr:DUF2884 family protein [Lysobacter sp.]
MNTVRTLAATALLAALPALTACDAGERAAREEEKTVVASAIRSALKEARQDLRHEDMTISEGTGHPEAVITAKGDLVIDGKPVPVNAEQRALLLQYRGHLATIAEHGIEIGAQGADIAATAVGEAFKGVFNGKSGKDIERSIEAKAAGIKASAAVMCEQLPALMGLQQKLAASLPAFRPYATMDQDDIDDCRRDTAPPTTADAGKPDRG